MTPTTAQHLAYMRLGLTADEVAHAIHRSAQTVRNYRYRLRVGYPKEYAEAKRVGKAARLERATAMIGELTAR